MAFIQIITDSNNKAATEGGVSTFYSCDRGRVGYSELIGQSGQTDNYSGVRVQSSDGFRIYNNSLHGFIGFTNNAGVITYRCNTLEIDQNEIYDCTHWSTAEIRHGRRSRKLHLGSQRPCNNLIHDVNEAFRLHGPLLGPGGEFNEFYQNICYDCSYFMEATSDAVVTGEQSGLRFYNNSAYNLSTGPC